MVGWKIVKCKLHREGPSQDFNPGHCCCEANVLSTAPLCSHMTHATNLSKQSLYKNLICVVHTVIPYNESIH